MNEVKSEKSSNPLSMSDYDDTAVWLSQKLREHSGYTLGNVLTAIEASLGDTKQSEALKSIIRREIYAMIDRNQAEIYVRAKMQKAGVEEPEIHLIDDENGEHEGYVSRDVREELVTSIPLRQEDKKGKI